MKNKKLLIATGIYPPDIGGPATYARTLFEELPKRGCEVKVISYADGSKKSKIKNQKSNNFKIQNPKSKIYQINRKYNKLLRYWLYFKQVRKLAGWADVIYAQDAINSGLPVWLCSKLKRKKYYLKIVGDYAWEQGKQKYGVKELLDDFQNKRYGFRVELLRKIQKMVANSAEKIIVPSHYLKNIVTNWGIEAEKIRVIYNSVKPAEPVRQDKNEIKKELDIAGDLLISVGRLVPWKGFDTLINIFPDLLKINPNFKLIIVGEGPEYTNYKLQITNYKLENSIILKGALKQEELWKYMRISDIFILNTGYEGLPHIIIEAMQLGVPVITTSAGGNTEVVGNNQNGILIEYNDCEQLKNAIVRLYQDKDLAASLSSNAKESVKDKFSKDRMIEEIIKIFNF